MNRHLQESRQSVRRAAIGWIRIYQRTLSPDHGPLRDYTGAGCRFYPSCSEYTAQAIQQKGLIHGIGLGAWRIIRCNPFSAGGIDEVK